MNRNIRLVERAARNISTDVESNSERGIKEAMVSESDKEAFWAKNVAKMKVGLKPEFDAINANVATVEQKVNSLRIDHDERFDRIDSSLAAIKKHLGI